MATIKEAIMTILNTDAQINNAANLGGMLGKSSTAPYGIYYFHPPDKPTIPIITYSMGNATGEQPRLSEVLIRAWSDTNLVDICDRVHDLLQREQLASLVKHRFLQCIWDWASPEEYDDRLETYTRTDRYLVKSWKT